MYSGEGRTRGHWQIWGRNHNEMRICMVLQSKCIFVWRGDRVSVASASGSLDEDDGVGSQGR